MIDEENSYLPATEAAQEAFEKAVAQIIYSRWLAAITAAQTYEKKEI